MAAEFPADSSRRLIALPGSTLHSPWLIAAAVLLGANTMVAEVATIGDGEGFLFLSQPYTE